MSCHLYDALRVTDLVVAIRPTKRTINWRTVHLGTMRGWSCMTGGLIYIHLIKSMDMPADNLDFCHELNAHLLRPGR